MELKQRLKKPQISVEEIGVQEHQSHEEIDSVVEA